MKFRDLQDLYRLFGGSVSRRKLLKGAAAFAAAPPAFFLGGLGRLVPSLERDQDKDKDRDQDRDEDQDKGSIFAYVGAYTPNGQGIYLFSMDLGSGALTQLSIAAMVPNPSWIAIHPNGNFLYAVNEISNFNGGTTGSVSAFSINRATGALSPLGPVVSSQGSGPAFVSVDPLGNFAFVANYGGGRFAVLPIHNDGSLGNATFVQTDTGSVGPMHATDAPPGSFAISGHDAPHAHMIEPDAAGKFVLGIDLGQDRIYIWTLDRTAGQLVSPTFVSLPPGDGPRHFAFHPNDNVLYSLQEEASTLVVYSYDPSLGTLTQQQQISTLPTGFVGTNFTSEVRVSADGSLVYAANRLHNSIAFFEVGASGTLTPVSEVWTRGDYPRSFTVDPTGRFLVCCNQRSDALTTFRIRHKKLEFTGKYTPVGSPACVVFLT